MRKRRRDLIAVEEMRQAELAGDMLSRAGPRLYEPRSFEFDE